MPIESWYERYIHPTNEYHTCPECGGSGKDNYTLNHKCCKCSGFGEIKNEQRKSEE